MVTKKEKKIHTAREARAEVAVLRKRMEIGWPPPTRRKYRSRDDR